MQIELVLKGLELGRYARERIDHKIGKATDRYHREFPVRVVVEDNKGTFQARVMTAVNGKELVGHHESRSVLEALDEAILKFDRQLLKIVDRDLKKPKARRSTKEMLAFSDVLHPQHLEIEGIDEEAV